MKVNIHPEISRVIEDMKQIRERLNEKNENQLKKDWEVHLEGMERSRIYHEVEDIAKKIARGEYVSERDKALIEKNNPEKLLKAQMANNRRRAVESRLKMARSQGEAKRILAETRVEVTQVYSGKDEEYAELLSEAYNKLTDDYVGKRLGKKDEIMKRLDIKV